jgi:HEAT repeat protein
MEKGPLSSHAGQVLDQIGKGKILETLKSKLMTGQKETCQAIAPILIKLGKRAVPYLLPLLEETEDQVVHKTACEILVRIDPSNINLILTELDRQGFGTTSTVRIIRALGDTECDEWVQTLAGALQSYFKHENPRLREEALWSYYRIMGAKGEKMYLALLSDVDITVQKRAIQCLGRMKSEAALEKFLLILKDLGNDPPGKPQQIVSALFGALAFYGNIERPGGGSLEDFLLETLERQVSLGPLKFLKKKKDVLSEGAVAAIVETLGKIGTKKSRSVLDKFEKQDNMMWKSKAAEALKRIFDRPSTS